MKKHLLLALFLLIPVQVFALEDMAEIGLSTTHLDLPVGVPLAGYGSPKRRVKGLMDLKGKHPYTFFFAPSEGKMDPIKTRAMVIRKNGKMVVFVSADFTGITSDFVKALAERLKPFGVSRENLIVSGTHTHSGPGAMSKRFALAILAADLFNKKVFNHVMEKIVHNVMQAIYTMKPGHLYDLTFPTKNLQRNRRERPGHFDSHARILLAKDQQGEWLGGMLNYAIHGTALGGSNKLLSADVPGAIVNQLEDDFQNLNLFGAKKPTFLFVNGAEGDVAPIQGGQEGMKMIGESFSEQALEHLPLARPILNPVVNFKSKNVFLGFPKFNIRACVESPKIRKFIAKFLAVPLGTLMPLKSRLTSVQVGDITMMTWPGEPTTDLGLRLQGLAKSKGHAHPWVLGLTNDYTAYYTTKKEFNHGGYEACSSLYSYRGGRRILKGYKKLLQ